MAFNMDKCWLCTITRKCNPIIYDYNMRGKALKRVEAQPDLTVLITCDARFNKHIYVQVNKAYKMLGFIRCSLSSRSDQTKDKRLRSYSSNKLKINKVRTELFKGTFFNRLPYLWYNLPDKLRTSNLSLSLFKKQCNEFYKKKSFNPDHLHATWM